MGWKVGGVALVTLLECISASGCASMTRLFTDEPVKKTGLPGTTSELTPIPSLPVPAAGAGSVGTAGLSSPSQILTLEPPPAIRASAITESVPGNLPPASVSVTAASVPPSDDYVIGDDDEIEISVYGDPDLIKTQAVRPGGHITFPLIGSIRAAGLTPEALRQEVMEGVSKYVRNAQVTVIVKAYHSRKVGVLGQVKTPGLLRLSTDITLLDGLSRAGGVTEDADLQGSLVLRGQQFVPVDFIKLLKQGDASQNIPLRSGDMVLVPNIKDKKVFVLGEVSRPQVVGLKPGTTLIESVALAGGFTRDAQKTNVLLVRGGLGNPKLFAVNVDEITDGAPGAQDLPLEPGDIVYVPKTLMAKVVRFFQDISSILTPFVLAESGLVLGPSAYSVLTTGRISGQQPVVVNPNNP